jgi:hypothetical protein
MNYGIKLNVAETPEDELTVGEGGHLAHVFDA